MIWLLCGGVTLIVVAGLLWPLLRSPVPVADRSAYDMAVFRDQLLELDRDVERGVITAAEAEAARLEIQRRLLTAGKAQPVPVRTEAPGQRAALTAAIAVLVPFAALGVYLTVGAPQLTGKTTHTTQEPVAGHTDADMAALVDKLAARVRETPDNPQGWSLLARSYRQMERFADAADAYRHLMALQPDLADGYAGFGEAATGAADGTVTPEAHAAFVHALQIDRGEPRARFYLGMEQAQAGNAKGAIAIWREMTASAPTDAPWINAVREQMAAVAQDAGIMPMSVTPRHALDVIGDAPVTMGGNGPSPAQDKQIAAAPPSNPPGDPATPDTSALKGRFTPEQQEMIKGMVGGLATRLAADPDNPANYDGWMRLGRAYTVLENTAGAKDAYGHAIKLKPQELAPKLQLADLLVHETDFDAKLPAALVRIATDIHALNAAQPDALFILGLDKARSGDTKSARNLWQSALAAAPPNTPLHDEITRRLVALP
ncbi:MAG: c-type cytochrome biogenesis protein CcmI [Rhodospirillaceae bacterium]|nr:MAG: c-type cytochrome biogenesis protein CcmI [Rhodospirillaceae bacterium]